MSDRPDMTPERHQRAMELFHAALEAAPERCEAFLEESCGSDIALRAEVLSLLKWDAAPGRAGADAAPVPASGQDAPVVLPAQIGPFEILGVLGVGGMSTVYRARQRHPERLVALKVLRVAPGGSVAAHRFAREIDVLARLRHPGIALIHGAGAAVLDGHETQYFAMELVDGPPLTEYAETASLDRNERVELLLRICDAVRYAHQRGIIHRDLKPANILVERTPEGGRPRVLDFGIARLLDGQDAGSAFVTQEHRIVGTLAYMSPERFEPDGAVDTQADVYALGAIAYELLGGRPPIDLEGLSTLEAIRRILAQAPPPLERLRPGCRGDLGLIVHKALAKEPAERYASVEALADDLRAFLQHRPIRARGHARLYAFRKFARRNRLAMSLASLLLVVALVGGLGTARGLVSARRANLELERQLAENTKSARFLVREVVSGLNSIAGTAEIRRTLLQRLVVQVETLRARDPADVGLMEDHAAALTLRSDALVLAERYDEALEDRRNALHVLQTLAQREPESHARQADVSLALVRVGDIHNGWNDVDTARGFYERAYAVDCALVEAEPGSVRFLDNLAFSHDRLGSLAMRREDYDSAEEHFQARLAITERLLRLAPERDATRHGSIMIQGYLADIARQRGDLPAAERCRRAAHAAAQRLSADRPHDRLYTDVLVCASRDLAGLLVDTERLQEAAGLLDEAMRAAARLHEADPHDFHPANLYFDVLRRSAELALSQGDEAKARWVVDRARELVQSDAIQTAGNGVPAACAGHLLSLNARIERLHSPSP